MTIRRLLVLTIVASIMGVWGVDSALACHKKKCYYVKPCPPPAPPKAPAPVKKAEAPAPAKVYVNLPAKAKLFVDDRATASTSAERMFYTPELDPEKAYTVTLRAEIPHAGGTMTEVRRIRVRAGEDVIVDITAPAAAVAAK